MTKKLKSTPGFQNGSEERAFWEGYNSKDYVDWTHTGHVSMPNLKPMSTTTPLSVPEALQERFDTLGNWISSAYARIPFKVGSSEIDAACASERKRR